MPYFPLSAVAGRLNLSEVFLRGFLSHQSPFKTGNTFFVFRVGDFSSLEGARRVSPQPSQVRAACPDTAARHRSSPSSPKLSRFTWSEAAGVQGEALLCLFTQPRSKYQIFLKCWRKSIWIIRCTWPSCSEGLMGCRRRGDTVPQLWFPPGDPLCCSRIHVASNQETCNCI